MEFAFHSQLPNSCWYLIIENNKYIKHYPFELKKWLNSSTTNDMNTVFKIPGQKYIKILKYD